MKKIIYFLILISCCILAACDGTLDHNIPGENDSAENSPVIPDGSESAPELSIEQLYNLFSSDIDLKNIGITVVSGYLMGPSIKEEYESQYETERAQIYSDYQSEIQKVEESFTKNEISSAEKNSLLSKAEIEYRKKTMAFDIKWKLSKVWDNDTCIFAITNTSNQTHSIQVVLYTIVDSKTARLYLTDRIDIPRNVTNYIVDVNLKTYGDYIGSWSSNLFNIIK